jgi:pimeloyl-ACP methyl ester carboxylesterase
MGQASQAFRLQFDSDLSNDFHLVAFDLRGHGLSGKPWQSDLLAPSEVWAADISVVIKVMNLVKPTVVGWSYGGYVVLDYVRHYGIENLSGINFVGSLGGLVPRKPFPKTLATKVMLENSMRSRSKNLLENIISAKLTAENFYTSTMSIEDKDAQLAMGLMLPSYVRRLMSGRKLDNTDLVSVLQLPVLFTRGSNDLMMRTNDTEIALSIIDGALHSFYPETGHLPFFQNPDRFNVELRTFSMNSHNLINKN